MRDAIRARYGWQFRLFDLLGRLRGRGGQLDRIARVAQVDEVDALDHPPGIHVQAGDDPNSKRHAATLGVVE